MKRNKVVRNKNKHNISLVVLSLALGFSSIAIPSKLKSFADVDRAIVETVAPIETTEATNEEVHIVINQDTNVNDLTTVIPETLDENLPFYTEIGRQEGIKELKLEAQPKLEERFFYALYDTEGRRNDLNEHTLGVLVDTCEQYNVSPDLMLGIIMTESEGHSNAKNKSSTATGFCQILRSSGKYIYEDLMGNPKGSYSHDMAYDPDLNLRMGVVLVSELKREYKGNTYKAIQHYRGKNDISDYLANINKYTRQVGLEALDL